MIELPLWRECKRCTRFYSTPELSRCSDPFSPTGICPLPNDRQVTSDHPFHHTPVYSHKYASLLNDVTLASIFQRWRRGEVPNDDDYLYIRALVLHPDHFMKEDRPVSFLNDVVFETLIRTAGDFARYNLGIPEPDTREGWGIREFSQAVEPVTASVLGAFGLVVYTAVPAMIEVNARQGSEWSRLMLDQIRLLLWSFHGCKHIDFSDKSDSEFRNSFEQEWQELLQYQDGFYGFVVIPKIGIKDMVRYQKLPHGDARIRRTISAYLTHQATEYPHWVKPWADKFTEVAFESRIRESYSPLIEALAEQVMENLKTAEKDSTSNLRPLSSREQMRRDIEQQLWQQYEKARQDFNFYWDHRDRQRPLGKVGFVGLQDEKMKRQLDTLMEKRGLPFRTQELSEVSFAHFIKDRLRRWVAAAYPADARSHYAVSLDTTPASGQSLGEQVSGDNSWNADSNHISASESVVIGSDGTSYLTIHQVAKRCGLTVEQLRRLDRKGIVPARRVKDVCEKPWTLNADVRLYPLTPEFDQAMQLAKARLEKHSSQLEGDEIDRKTAAKIVGVSVAALCKWEKQGLVKPGRKGKIVVYDQKALEQAKAVKQKSKRLK